MIETLAVLTVVAAVAALLLWWPRARQGRQPTERHTRPMTHGSGRQTSAPGFAASESEAATRLRRDMAERVHAARQARERGGAASQPPARTADEAANGFAETTLLEDPHR
jgi:hypothetical protein